MDHTARPNILPETVTAAYIPQPITREDVVIAVLGVTGSGKSAFISQFCSGAAQEGHGLKSCTSEVRHYTCMLSPGQNLHLVDTPGFDDTTRSDTDILKDIALFLSTTYQRKIYLSGLIYLHRIIDPRVTGSIARNLRFFKKLCGDDSFQRIALVSTMWDRVDAQTGASREAELTSTGSFWGDMVARGSKVYRHDGSFDSASSILTQVLSASQRTVLHIQRQMVDQRRDLDQTDAGMELEAELLREKQRMQRELTEMKEEMEEAMRERDGEAAEALRKQQLDYEAKIRESDRQRENMRVGFEKMHAEKEKEMRKLVEKWNIEKKSIAREINEKQRLLESLAAQVERMGSQMQKDSERLQTAQRELEAAKKELSERREEYTRVARREREHGGTSGNAISTLFTVIGGTASSLALLFLL
ncbi:P-loop containing nucleoside triphosphate hydrolase protein [Immersiella caudata]|uniref:P-loop containing nucleoside triphosphate hydrolase protein n=1 Tax=Immersiella caudata TaxID=314043 RepID=A0AA39TX57_9PEZI|nr:P-loop containing nucleoside triphosphate hydrolase protein [Immersiella caudata]